MSFSKVGSVYDIPLLRQHLSTVSLRWAKRGVCIHHTAYPDLAMRPKGLTVQHIRNMEDGYRNDRGWSSGPHLYVDEDQIFGMSPMNKPGVHSIEFNRDTISIEMLGDYDVNDSPEVGRGAEVVDLTVQAVATILEAMGLEASPETIHFHRDDPNTSKTCPGLKIEKSWFISKVRECQNSDDRKDRPKKGFWSALARLFGFDR